MNLKEANQYGRLKSDLCYGAARNDAASLRQLAPRIARSVASTTAVARKSAYLQVRFRSEAAQRVHP